MKFYYKDKDSTKQKFHEIASNPILPAVGPGIVVGLRRVFHEIDIMEPGDVQTWNVTINFSGGFSDTCHITLDLSDLTTEEEKESASKEA